MDPAELSEASDQLAHGELHTFAAPLDPALPLVAAGCYTIWDEGGRLIYAGMAGRSLTRESIAEKRLRAKVTTTGLRDRLRAHRSGRRSGDQFCVYAFDRLVLPSLSPEAIAAAAAGECRLDDDVQAFIQAHLSYRWCETVDGIQAYRLEATLVTGGLNGCLPLLNPRQAEET
jgi:hypothetical protein